MTKNYLLVEKYTQPHKIGKNHLLSTTVQSPDDGAITSKTSPRCVVREHANDHFLALTTTTRTEVLSHVK